MQNRRLPGRWLGFVVNEYGTDLVKGRDVDQHAAVAVRDEFSDSKGDEIGSASGVLVDDRMAAQGRCDNDQRRRRLVSRMWVRTGRQWLERWKTTRRYLHFSRSKNVCGWDLLIYERARVLSFHTQGQIWEVQKRG